MSLRPPPPDQKKWDDAAQAFQEQLLTRVQESAGVWAGAISALLGIFGAVALVTGPTEIGKVSDGLQPYVIAIIIAAGLAAGASLLLAALAQQLPSVKSNNWNGTAYRLYVVGRADSARLRLAWSKALGIAAAVSVFALGVTVLIDGAMQS